MRFDENKNVAEFQKKLLSWFRENCRKLPWRETSDPYYIWVSEVMLQQTQVIKVVDYYVRFIERFPDIRTLAAADLHDVLQLWEGLGYYSRARNLHKAAQIVHLDFEDTIPRDYAAFLKLPGVGEYIAAAVTSRAFNAPYAVVDGNVKRVLSRLFLIESPVNISKSEKQFQEHANRLFFAREAGPFNEAMMELGALICRPQNPSCSACPMNFICKAYDRGQQRDFPKRIEKKKSPTYDIGVGVIYKNGQFLIIRRPESGLLGGMWEFPGGRVSENEKTHEACLRKIREKLNIDTEIIRKLCTVKHAYTHFKIVMDVYICRYLSGDLQLNGPMDSRWITLNEVGQFAFHNANHKFIPLISQISRENQ